MNTYEFLFYIELPESVGPLESYRAPLSNTGCRDILFGDGGARSISFNLAVSGRSLQEAFELARLTIMSAVPHAVITGVLNLADIDEAAENGITAIEEGRYIELNSPDDIARFFDRIQASVKRRDRWRSFGRKLLSLLNRLPGLRTPVARPDADEWEFGDPLENTPPVRGSGEFLRDRGYPDPGLTKEKFELVSRIRMAADKVGLDAAGVSSAIDNAGLSDALAGNGLRILRGNVSDISADDLRALLVILKMKERSE